MRSAITLLLVCLCCPAIAADKSLDITLPGVTTTITLPPIEIKDCAAEVTLDYFQSNNLAKVETTIANNNCAASSGDYLLTISVRGDDGELKTLEFPRSWSRTDDKSLVLKEEVPIGDNVDLIRVRARKGTCKCADAGNAETAPAAQAEGL